MNKPKPSTIHHQPSTILLVGGGTGGHIFPLYRLAEKLLQDGHTVHLIVNDSPLDRQIINDKFRPLSSPPLGGIEGGLNLHFLKTHKIDYHLSLRNLIAPFKIVGSFFRTKNLIKKINPDVVFFKGGFVGFPVLVALRYLKYLNHLPFTIHHSPKIFLHDSDISAGALTRFIGKNADHIFTNFGNHSTPLFYWPNFSDPGITRSRDQKPKMLIFGGSQGAQFLNHLITQKVEELTQKYHITLVTGPKNTINHQPSTITPESFKVVPFMPQDELIEAMLQADVVIARSGASVFQVLAAKTKLICVPLPSSARNHQLHNAQYFQQRGLCYLLEQNDETHKKLLPMIEQILADKDLEQKLKEYKGLPQVEKIVRAITA